MQFEPKTQEEIDAMSLFTAGEYGFEILEKATFGANDVFTKDTTSKAGNDMIALVVNVYHAEGYSRVVTDYLLEAMPKKLRDAAYACGLGDKYESGHLSALDFIGKTGNLKLAIQKGKEKEDGSGVYPDKNSITGYVVPDKASSKVSVKKAQNPEEDFIPF